MKTHALLLLLFTASVFGAEAELQLTLPPVWYGVTGVPVSLYYDNVMLTEKPETCKFDVKCDIGVGEARRWTVTPEEKDVGDHAMTVTVSSGDGKVVEVSKTLLRIASRTAGAGRNLKLLIVGDSLTAATLYPNEIARLLNQPDNPKWTMLSDHKPSAAVPGVAHEGYGGWTWSAFLSRYVEKPDPAKKSISSPFVYADAQGKPALDLQRYFREHCNGQIPDVVTFLLGINDCFHVKADDDAAVDTIIDRTLDNAAKLIAAFHAAAPGAVFAVGLTTPPNARESGFEANYHGAYHRWGWKQIQYRLVRRMIERFGGSETSGVFLVPTELNLDPVEGFPENNGVHPNPTGYAQIGDSFYAWLKNWLAARR
ncbi:MAG: GDSL-like Lipase/Acylhydrolase [Verrucomicrobiaceae bacterium]|nr:GDSL-like Lipase/Acylhydrolase [Verrucomicrobiaceae bacterium]